MALKDKWIDKVDGVDEAIANDINQVARAVIQNEEDLANIKNVYASKKYVNNFFANALKGNKSGEVFSINDVSPVEHELEVNVSSKNLFDISKVVGRVTSSSGSVNKVENGTALEIIASDTSNGVPGGTPNTLRYYAPHLVVGETYVLSANTTSTTKHIYLSISKVVWEFGKTRTITEDDLNSIVIWYASGVNTTAIVRNIQIEKGTTATAYAPYLPDVSATKITVSGGETEKTYDVNADGSVGVVESIYPSMTLYSNTNGVLIECEYNRDINKAFAELQSIVNTLVGG